jgi:hypothetical protein
MHPHSTTCAICDKPIPSKRIYCSKRCYGDSRITRIPTNCIVCGKPFMSRSSVVAQGMGQCCSKSCSNRLRAIPPEQRFWAHVDKGNNDGCWEWTAARDKKGYGVFSIPGRKQVFAHRYSYELAYGSVPPDILVLHHCDNPGCVRPTHLFMGTHADNMTDMVNKGRSLFGERHPGAILTEQDVVQIRQLHSTRLPLKTIANQFQVTPATVAGVVYRKSWRHLS